MAHVQSADHFKSRSMLAAMALAGLILFYLLGSRALDTGSWWQYLGCLIVLIFSIKTFAGIFKK